MEKKKQKKMKNKEFGDVYISGDINEEMLKRVMEETAKHEDDNLQMEIYICTNGGDPFYALAIYDYIRNLSSYITMIALGKIDSAGVLVYLAGDERLIGENGSIMIHSAQAGSNGTMSQDRVNQLSQDIAFIEERKLKIMSKKTKLSKKQIQAFIIKSTRFDAKKAVRYGFAHKII